ncbi:multidrug efflux SMR transporter [Rhodobacteraceae bacterium XHP0102]|nr:multidrug efflux SMR transporter [Rhodobacteraceae bacterium XHP0102]
MHWLYLTIAIVAEVAGTSALKASDGFTRVVPSVVVVISYGLAFVMLAQALRVFDLAVAYAIWSGAGIAAIALVGFWFYGQKLDLAGTIGIGMIIGGIVVVQLFSNSAH